ncbi:hypothetical protein Mal15_50790 [Stieleria maiorica]|uniref:Uncharacterized protein n=1 Tax=Stieleria maiorica TaxID=2795974 RepID=A0A5B9MI59_9BACT|nr:hypothetical protein [Stieleria maiorica]QEG01003.1 hypothetical protein Mal15_50790 [Stieleria maiorica]
MNRILLGLAVAVACCCGARDADAKFAGESDYEYTVLYDQSTYSFWDFYYDLYYDFALYIESPSIPGYWQMVGDEPFDTRAEAEYWEAFFESTYNTSIVAIPSTPTWSRR